MDFTKWLQPVPESCIYKEAGYYVWCASMFKYREAYYMVYSRWPRSTGFNGWVTDSEICLAKADSLLGAFHHCKVVLTKHTAPAWDADCAHNPVVLEHEGMFYLYYMGNYGNGEYWDHRNHQRIGVGWAADPEGEWQFGDAPAIDISPIGCFDSLMTSNPTVTHMPDGRILMVYKGVEDNGERPWGGKCVCGVAIAEDPKGPFVKANVPIMQNPEHKLSVEDPFIWYENGEYLSLVKDFNGYFTHTDGPAIALFRSKDGFDWQPDPSHPLAAELKLVLDGVVTPVYKLERPQMYIEDGKKLVLLCAGSMGEDMEDVFSVRIPLKDPEVSP